MRPHAHRVSVDHRDVVLKFITSLREAIPHRHFEFVTFLSEMYESSKLAPTRPTNFTTHTRVILWFVENSKKDHQNAQRYHTLVMSYINSIAFHDTLPNARIDFLIYAGHLLS